MNNLLNSQLIELLGETRDFLANSSNFTSFIYNYIPNLNWVGFYFDNGKELILSIFQGKPACIKIAYNKGVCGKAFQDCKLINVPNVHNFVGHIACDSASNSELVIPITIKDKIVGVLDIDSPFLDRFGSEDVELINNFLLSFINCTDFDKIIKYYEN